MIGLPSLRNVEFGSFFGEVLLVSGSRSQISLPWKFIFCRPKLKYGSWTNASLKSNVALPPVLVTAEEEEVKVVLHKFLTEQGFSSALAASTVNKSDRFIEHLVLYSLQNGSPVGHELTATEIRDALTPYLESLLDENESNLIDFLENFPNSPAKRDLVAKLAAASLSNSRKLKALSRVTETGPDGQLPQHILYLLELCMDLEHIKKIICRYPSFAYFSLDGEVRPWIEFLHSLGLSNSDISTILIRVPHLFAFSLSAKVLPIMEFLENLGVNKKQFGKVIYRYPLIIARKRKKLEAIVDYLNEIGISGKSAGKIFVLFPQMVCLSLENNLRPTAEYFRSLGARVDVIMLRWPQVFARNVEGNLKPTTVFLLAKGFSREEVAVMVSRCAVFYACSLSQNLIPKWEFFLTMNYSKVELVKFPQYFSYSLEKRIKPRYAAVKLAGVHFSLSHMLALTDDKFARTLNAKIVNQRWSRDRDGREAGGATTE